MGEEIFRKKSLERIKSPESLKDYVRVANPSVWLILTAIIVLLLGGLLWGFFGRIETKIPISARVSDETCTFTAPSSELQGVVAGMTVRNGRTEGSVTEVSINGDQTMLMISIPLSDGLYEMNIVLESIAPLSFLTN